MCETRSPLEVHAVTKQSTDFRGPGAEFSGSASIELSYQEWRELLSCVQASRVVIATSTYKALQDAHELAFQRDNL